MATLDAVLTALERWGLLLLQDPVLPAVAAIVAGAPVVGSWWGHPAGHAIFRVAGELADHPDALTMKLCGGKVTFVHRSLWPALVGVGSARAAWQLDGLGEEARALLARVDAEGTVRTDGKPAKALESRLLVASRQVHTERGAHATELVAWAGLARERGIAAMAPVEGAALLESRVGDLEARFSTRVRIPWRRGAKLLC